MNEQESSVRATLLFLLVVPVCLIIITFIIYDISYAITGQYSFTFSRQYVGWQTGDGAVIVWIPTYVLGLFFGIFPLVILLRAYLLRSSAKGLEPLENLTVLKIAGETAEIAEIDPPALYTFADQRIILDVFGTNENPILRLSSTFIDFFRERTEELKALFLHEYSHILNKDVGLLTLRSSFIHTLGRYLLVSFGYQCYNGYMYATTYTEIPPSEMGTKVLFRIFGNQLVLFLGLVILYFLVTSIYREREFLADRETVSMMKNSKYLISALKESEKMIPKGVYIEILSDHPSIQKRIDALERKRSLSIAVFWIALTLTFCTLVVTEIFVSSALLFLRHDMYALQRFYDSLGVWIHFVIDVGIPVVVFLYLFKVGNTLKSFMNFVSKSSVVCGIYAALRVGYYFLERILSQRGYNFLDMARLSVGSRYFHWAHILWFDFLGDNAMIPLRIIRRLDMPFRLRNALELWVVAFAVMLFTCLLLGIFVFGVRRLSIQRIMSPSRRIRLFIVVLCEILLISGCIATQIPQEDKTSAVEEWVMSYYKVYDYKDPHSQTFVKAGSFDFDTQYDIADNFYGIHTLKSINGLGNLKLTQREELIRWLCYHQDNSGDFFMDFYFFDLDYKASIWEEQLILLSLEDLGALDAIGREGAIQYALSEYEDYPWEVFDVIQTLFVLDAVDKTDKQLQLLVEKYFLDFEYEPEPELPELCYEGVHFCWEVGWECILCTYWGVLTLEKLGTLDVCDKEIITSWIVNHYTEDGGFCEGLIVDWWPESPETYQGSSDLESTFYAVKSLQVLDQLDAIDRERTIHYVLSYQTRKGGFARTPGGNPTFEDTYYAVEILDALDALDRLNEPYKVSNVLLEIFHGLPLIFYMLVGALIVGDLWLYYKVWK
ncbi:MAG: hypothetical protein AYK19_10880 [Theionarchaea archaeon DG-70-1]|nr:MAG: hypothetical protein AYK19_10880 [Theionarchaea archaeon DG-70-1]